MYTVYNIGIISSIYYLPWDSLAQPKRKELQVNSMTPNNNSYTLFFL